MVTLTNYTIKVVKERATRYDVSNKVNQPEDAYEIIKIACGMEEMAEEHLLMMTLDTKNKVTGIFTVSQGSLNSSIVHPREVFKRAVAHNANAIIIFHNHPSGDSLESTEDVSITKRLYECGKLLGIELLDHLIIGENNFTSLKQKGII